MGTIAYGHASKGYSETSYRRGASVHQQFIDTGLWDEAIIETSTLNLQEGVAAATLKQAELTEEKTCFGHTIQCFRHCV